MQKFCKAIASANVFIYSIILLIDVLGYYTHRLAVAVFGYGLPHKLARPLRGLVLGVVGDTWDDERHVDRLMAVCDRC